MHAARGAEIWLGNASAEQGWRSWAPQQWSLEAEDYRLEFGKNLGLLIDGNVQMKISSVLCQGNKLHFTEMCLFKLAGAPGDTYLIFAFDVPVCFVSQKQGVSFHITWSSLGSGHLLFLLHKHYVNAPELPRKKK